MPPVCGETALDRDTRHLVCVLDKGHDGDHQDAKGRRWEPAKAILDRLKQRWGRTHRLAWTGSYWVATAHNRRAPHRSHIEPTPEQLEESLQQHHGQPPTIPEMRSPMTTPDRAEDKSVEKPEPKPEKQRKERKERKPRTRVSRPSYAGGFFHEMPGGAMFTHPDDR